MAVKQRRSVIQWVDPDPDFLIQRWSEDGDEIKSASQLILGPGQGCVFTLGGKIEGLFDKEGTFVLETGNVPFWTTVSKALQGFESENKVGLWFYQRTQQTQQKFGTPTPVKYLDPVYGFPVGLRVFGNFTYRIKDPRVFFREVQGLTDVYEVDQGRALISSKMLQPLTEVLAKGGFTYTEIDARRSEIAGQTLATLVGTLGSLGLEVLDLKIDGTSFDEETMMRIGRVSNLQAEAAGARAVGLDFVGLKEAEAPRDPEGSAPKDDPAGSLKKIQLLLSEGLITQEEYDSKRKEILSRI